MKYAVLLRKCTSEVFLIVFISVFFIISPNPLFAEVSGVCSNCHIMHNSQDGDAQARSGAGVGWNLSGQLIGGSTAGGPQNNALVTDCVGCHSSTTGDTIINVGGADIPIVFNTGGYPATPLAGGNFFTVSQGTAFDSYGHNVYGISAKDVTLTSAPGTVDPCAANACHASLAVDPVDRNQSLFDGKGGCQGCHFQVFHHKSDNSTNTNTGYRFLWGHSWEPPDNYVAYVEGVEDPDWEFTNDTVDHNYYKGTTDPYINGGAGLKNKHTITAFCSGCHNVFHGPFGSQSPGAGMGSASPWKRHPTDIALLETGEFAGYDPTTLYKVEAPVAWVNPLSPIRSQAIVMCLSCHRAHGSQQPDMLRWDYDSMEAGTTGAGAEKGCFICHTGKDGI